MNKFSVLFFVMLSAVALFSCETAQEQLGLNKHSPDEFKVLKRAPLEMPPQYALRPPSPGAPRPQEQTSVDEAREAVFGEAREDSQHAPTTAEGALLQQAGANNVEADIRSRVDEESANMVDENEPVIKKLMNIGSHKLPSASVVDAEKEAERLQKNSAEGKPVTDGETPSVGD